MKATLYPIIDLDRATPDELRRHARDLHHRMSGLVKLLESYEDDVDRLKKENAKLKDQRLSLLGKR